MSKLTYREFSKISQSTIRTLRYYESLGLLQDELIDGIKYLDDSNLIKMQTIQLLKKANYTLMEIKEILSNREIEDQLIMQQDLLNIQMTNIKTMLGLIERLKQNNGMENQDIYREFLRIQNASNLQLQFQTPVGLQTRIKFHQHHTQFHDNYHQWMFSHYSFTPQAKILEIGCGDGSFWLSNADKIPNDVEITLTDLSESMVKESQQNLKHIKQINACEIADCYHLPYSDHQFDIVIANHVLMYFEDLSSALNEICRVLKTDGLFYCSTIGKEMMKERDALLSKFDKRISFDQPILYQKFGYENGKEKLAHYFNDIQLYERKEIYKITDLDEYYHFLLSSKGLGSGLEPLYKKQDKLYDYLKQYQQRFEHFKLTSHVGMFVSKNIKLGGH